MERNIPDTPPKGNDYIIVRQDTYLAPPEVEHLGHKNGQATVTDEYLTPTIAEGFPRKLPEIPQRDEGDEKPPNIYDRLDDAAFPEQAKNPRTSRALRLWCLVGIAVALCLCVLTGVLAWYFLVHKGLTQPKASPEFAGAQEAFSAYSPSNGTFAETPTQVLFSRTWTKYGTSYSNSIFTSPSADLYFFSLGALNHGKGGLNFSLAGGPLSIGLSRSSTTHNTYDSFGRNTLMSLGGATEIRMSFTGYLGCCYSTFWSGFSLSGAMDPLIALSVTSTRATSTSGPVKFEETVVNIGNWIIQDSDTFIAPINGIYYFAVSAGLPSGQPATLQLRKNNLRVFELLRSSSDHDGTDIISSSTMLSLNAGDKIHLELLGGALYSSDSFRETSLVSFLYRPTPGPTRRTGVAWSVRRTKSLVGNQTSGATEPVKFYDVLVNEDGVFSSTDHWATITRAGVYFVEVTVGVLPGVQARVFVRYGATFGSPNQAATISRETNTTTGYDTVTAGAVISLDVGHRVWVAANDLTGWGFYSNQNLVTGFTGFLIY